MKINQSTWRFKLFVSFATFYLIIMGGTNIISQAKKKTNSKTIAEQSKNQRQNSDNEVKKMIKILKEKKEAPEVIISTIQTLGNIRAEEAIPELIKYLDYEKVYVINQPKYPEHNGRWHRDWSHNTIIWLLSGGWSFISNRQACFTCFGKSN